MEFDFQTDNSDDGDDDNFGQTVPPLHIYVKRVLDKYPEGGQILKELLQNADDAGARRVIFLYDKTNHPTEHLWSQSLNQLYGPTLYVYNDATFKPEDWKNIQLPEQSGKHDDPTKVGRFGLGFISVYHITDVPSIFSGDRVGFLDPNEKYFATDPSTNMREKGRTGKRWCISTKLLQPPLKDQFTPFLEPLFDCTPDTFRRGQYGGTIFRFPLRKEGADSLISSSSYNEERVESLIRSFQNDAEISLLFLKNVESVSIYERSVKEERPQLIYRVEMSSEDKNSLQNERGRFLNECQLNKTTVSRIQAKISTQFSEQFQEQSSVNRYTIINYSKRDGLSACMQNLVENKDLKQLPWVGVAAKRVSNVQSVGRMFCFLPLPEREISSLPVHIHGYFGLCDNRRSIKWPDKESQHDIAARWNVGLVEEVFPDVYVDLIQTSISCGLTPSTVYGYWPRVAHLQGAWKVGVKQAISMLSAKNVLYTNLGGQWKKPSEVYIDTQNSSLIHRVLIQMGVPVVQLPTHILAALRWGNVGFHEVTPNLMRQVLKGARLDWLDRKEKMELLDYILQDFQPQSMENIYLLPLSNGNFVQFSRRGEVVYIPNSRVPKQLFPNMEDSLVSDDCPGILKTPGIQRFTQLKLLTVDVVPMLLKECLQKVWPNKSLTVKWIPGCSDQPQKDWLRQLWTWLQKEDISLRKFVSLPMIQIGMEGEAIILARIEPNRMIFQTHKSFATTLSEPVCGFLESIHAIVVRNNLPYFIERHTQIKEFIVYGNGEGVMKMVEARWSGSIPQFVSQSPACLKKDLLNLVSEIRRLSIKWKQMLRQLPLFETNANEFVSVQQCTEGVNDGFFGIPIKQICHKFILLNDHTSSLAKELGVREVDLENLLKHYILPYIGTAHYSQNERDILMPWLLDRAFLDKLVAKAKFIPSGDGLASPGELFDPDNILLRSLYHNKPVFPTQQYASGRLLGHIRRVGFKKEESITALEVLKIATETSQDMDLIRSKALLDFICNHPNQNILSSMIAFNNKTYCLGNVLNNIAWVNCEVSPPLWWYSHSLPWYQHSRSLHCPKEVQLERHSNLLGSVMPLVKVSKLPRQFGTFFSWTEDVRYIGAEHVIRHLKTVASAYKQNSRTSDHNMLSLIEDIHGFLDNTRDNIITEPILDLFNRENMNDVPWVWYGKGFATPHMVAFSSGISDRHLPQYLHLIPSRLRKFKKLLIKLGVKETFAVEDYLSILHSLNTSSDGKPLSIEEMDIVQDVLKAVTSIPSLQWYHERLLVPDCNCVLRPCDDVIYNDLTWDQTSEEFIYVHDSITRLQTKKLGIRSQRDVELDRCSSDLGCELPFGQIERLTTRLRGILREYSHTTDVLKELLQNADDAGAGELHVVYDRRKHTGSKISGTEWKQMHESPALCVYNDKPFTEEDIIGIQNVGIGGKISDATTTGRFGIGFNAVYHLTDCPTFLTQSTTKLGIFDPHVKYVPRASPSNPGKLYRKDSNCNYQTSFPDMIEGYLSEFKEFNLQEGTMFRFPLRQSGMESEISEQSYEPEHVYALLDDFEKVSSDSLFFLNNVQKISISEIDPISGELKLRYCVKSSLSDESQKQRRKITDQLKEYALFLQPMGSPQICCNYAMKVTDSRERNEDWLVCQTLGYSDPNKHRVQMREYMGKDFVPRGGVAVKINPGLHYGSKAFCFLPLQINTSLPVHVNGTFKLDQSRRNLKEGDTEIIHPWNKLLAEQVIAPAYAHLIDRARIWMFQSKYTLSIFNNGLWTSHAFDSLFPTKLNQLSGVWKLIAVSTLQYIGDHNMKVLPVIRSSWESFSFDEIQWLSPTYSVDNAFFDNLNTLDHVDVHADGFYSKQPLALPNVHEEKKSHSVRQFLLGTGFNLIACSPSVCRAFQAVEVEAAFISPKICVQHIRTTSSVAKNLPCHISKSAFTSTTCLAIILEYCLGGISDAKALYGLPLQLDGSNMVMTYSTSNAKYLTYDYNLIPRRPDIFIHRDILNILYGWLRKIRRKETVFKEFKIEDLAQFIHTQLPVIWKGSQNLVEWKPTSSNHPDEAWLQMLWRFIGSSDIGPLKDWPIFPTKCGKLLAPIIGKRVLFTDTYADSKDRVRVTTTLQKLGCPIVDVQKMTRPSQSTTATFLRYYSLQPKVPYLHTLTKYLALPVNHGDILNVIMSVVSNANIDISSRLTASECDVILRYFQDGVKTFSSAELNRLKRLPLFPCAYSRRRISIHQFQYCYTNEVSIPDFDIVQLMRETGCVFLKSDISLAELYKHLKIRHDGTIDIYRRHVLPILNQLSHLKQLIHVKFIRDHLLPNASKDEKDELQSKLKDVAFIPSADGQYHKASYYFDSDNHVFAKMVECDRFLPEEFGKPEWKPLLIDIGLQHTFTGSQFINFTKVIESHSREDEEPYEDLKEKSQFLLKEFIRNTFLHKREVLVGIASVRFIPSADDTNKFNCYRGGVPEQYWRIIYSVNHCLPTYSLPNDTHICRLLGVQSKPSIENVVKHTQNVCYGMVQYNAFDKEDSVGHLRAELSNILKEIMTFLSDGIERNGDTIKQLQNTPMCLVENRTILVKANQLVLEMNKRTQDQFRPYMYKAPRELAQFDTLLKILGTEEELTFDQISTVLSGLKAYCKDMKMDINQKNKAYSATRELYNLLIRTKGKCAINVKSLYLPTSDDKLQLTSQIHYTDLDETDAKEITSTSAIQLVVPLKQILGQETMKERELIMLLPVNLRPRKLDTKEKPLVSNSVCCTKVGTVCSLMAHTLSIIRSSETSGILMHLLQHQIGGVPNTEQRNNVDQLRDFDRIKCVRELKTGFFDDNGTCLGERKPSRYVFLDEKENGEYELSFSHTEISGHAQQGPEFFLPLAHSICKICKLNFDDLHIHIFSQVLPLPSMALKNAVLAESKVPKYANLVEFSTEKERPGSAVPRDIWCLLDNDMRDKFHSKEIAIYRPDDNVEFYIYVEILERLPPENTNAGFTSFCRQYKIDIGDDCPIIVSVLDLYKFRRLEDIVEQNESVTGEQTTTLTNEVVLYTGSRPRQRPVRQSGRAKLPSLEEVKAQIRRDVEEAMKLPEKERNKCLRRLYKMWHPDKNSHQIELATEAFKFIKQEIDRVTNKRDEPTQSSNYSQWNADINRETAEEQQYRQRAHQQRYTDRAYQQQYGQQQQHQFHFTNSRQQSGSGFFPRSFTNRRPDPRKAKLWFCQAKEDLKSAYGYSRNGEECSKAWTAFMIQQAIEKALKAVNFHLDGSHSMDHNLLMLISSACRHSSFTRYESYLRDLVNELIDLGCDATKPRYPEDGTYRTTGTIYANFDSQQALTLCKSVLDIVEQMLNETP